MKSSKTPRTALQDLVDYSKFKSRAPTGFDVNQINLSGYINYIRPTPPKKYKLI